MLSLHLSGLFNSTFLCTRSSRHLTKFAVACSAPPTQPLRLLAWQAPFFPSSSPSCPGALILNQHGMSDRGLKPLPEFGRVIARSGISRGLTRRLRRALPVRTSARGPTSYSAELPTISYNAYNKRNNDKGGHSFPLLWSDGKLLRLCAALRYVDLVLLHMARADGKVAMALALHASYMPADLLSSLKSFTSFVPEDCGAPKQCRQETWLALQRFQNKASPRPRDASTHGLVVTP